MLSLLLLLSQAAAEFAATPPPLFQAVRRLDPSAAIAMIESGADPNLRDDHGRTILQAVATSFGRERERLIRLLLTKGADPNARDAMGASAVDDAVWMGSAERTMLLLDAGGKINEPEAKTGATPLNEAAFQGHIDVAKLLLARGADVRTKDYAGYSPIENALRQRQLDMVQLLLPLYHDRELPNHLLEEAIRRGQDDAVGMLLKEGASINARSPLGSTPLYDAALKGDAEIVSDLVSRGADIDARDVNSGTTPLYAAAAFGRKQVVAILLLWGADPNALSKEGISPLHAAESNQYSDIAQQIRKAGGH
ncbi:MAG: ankyrin repeat domain-containing protein [Bryobacteraceae bacterium]